MKAKMIFCYKIWLFIDIKNQNKVIIFFLIDSLFYMFLEKRFINSVRISSWILRNGRWKSFTSCPRIYRCRKRKHRRKLQWNFHMSVSSFHTWSRLRSNPARRVPVGRWRREPDRLQKRLRFVKSERGERRRAAVGYRRVLLPGS